MIYKSKCRNACDVNVYIEFIEAIECWIQREETCVLVCLFYGKSENTVQQYSKDSPAIIEREMVQSH